MAKSLEWFMNNFNSLSVDPDRLKHLEELQIAVSTSNSIELQTIVPHLQLGIVFDCLNTSEKPQIESAVAILKKLLSLLSPVDVIKLYGASLGRALEHPEVEPRKLVLNELNRAAKNVELLTAICSETPLLISVIECVKHEDLSLAMTAANFLNQLGKVPKGMEVLYSSPILDFLQKAAAVNDSVRFRVYEIVVDISVNSVPGLHASANSGLLINLLNEIQSGDILLQLTSLETVSKLALCDHGLQFLKEKGLLNYLSLQLQEQGTALNGLLLPGCIKFFGNVAQAKPQEIFSEYPVVVNLLFHAYESNDTILSNVALETIGYIASTPAGKVALNESAGEMLNVIKTIGSIIGDQPSNRKVIALNVFTNLLQLNVPDQTPELLTITNTWFSDFPGNSMKTIMNVCEKPFLELKLAGLMALNAVAIQPWGQQEIVRCPGLIEYLQDRNEESDMNCKSAKYDIVKAILETPFAGANFSAEVIKKFETYVKQGVCFTPARTEVALEAM